MVMALVLFISSMLFIFYIFNVKETTKSTDSRMALFEMNFRQKAEILVTTYTAIIPSSESSMESDIVKIALLKAIPPGEGIRAESYEGEHFDSQISSDRKAVFVKRMAGNEKKNFVRKAVALKQCND